MQGDLLHLKQDVHTLFEWVLVREHLRAEVETAASGIATAWCGGGFIHPEHKYEYEPDELREELKRAGFVISRSKGICAMPATIAKQIFDYSDFVLGDPLTDNVHDAYIQFFHCCRT